MRIIPISLPTPFYIGPVNVYLIPEDPITIIDTGPKTKEAIEALRSGWRAAGFRVFFISPNLLTLAPEDNSGLPLSPRDQAKNRETFFDEGETGHSNPPFEIDAPS